MTLYLQPPRDVPSDDPPFVQQDSGSLNPNTVGRLYMLDPDVTTCRLRRGFCFRGFISADDCAFCSRRRRPTAS